MNLTSFSCCSSRGRRLTRPTKVFPHRDIVITNSVQQFSSGTVQNVLYYSGHIGTLGTNNI